MTELEDIRADWAMRDQSLAAAVRVQTNLLRETLAEQRLEQSRLASWAGQGLCIVAERRSRGIRIRQAC